MCQQCETVHINGVKCHEQGCPDAWMDYIAVATSNQKISINQFATKIVPMLTGACSESVKAR